MVEVADPFSGLPEGGGESTIGDLDLFDASVSGTTVDESLAAARVALFGPRTEGPMVPEPAFTYDDEPAAKPRLVASGEN